MLRIPSAALSYRLDASDVANNNTSPANNSVLNTWVDKSGNGNNAVKLPAQAAGTFTTNQINGRSVVKFTRTSGLAGSVYQIAGVDIRATISPAVTMFTVYKQGAQGGDQALWGNDDGGWDRFYFSTRGTAGNADNGAASLGPQPTPVAVVPNAGVVGAVRLMTAVYQRGFNDSSAIYFNGATVTTFTDQTDYTLARPTLFLGFDGDDNCFNGDVAEFIVYNRKLTRCEIQQVNRYLGAKYGITFSTVNVNAGGSTSFAQGGSVTLTASVSGTAYQWLRNGTPIAGATSQSYAATLSGDYRIAVTNSCVDTSAATRVYVSQTAPGNALRFDGVNDYVELPASAALATTNIKTMECWVRFDTLGGDHEILSKSVSGQGIELLQYGGELSFFCMNGSNVSSVRMPMSSFATGRWYHLAARWDGSDRNSMVLFVNGSVPTQYAYNSGNINLVGIANPATAFRIGDWGPRPFKGSIDEVRLWSVSRTQGQIWANMYSEITDTTGLLANFSFDQGTSNAANSAHNYAFDRAKTQHGSLVGFALADTASNFTESYAMVAPPVDPATNVTSQGFTVNWSAPQTGVVDNYFLDVATDADYTAIVPGYNSLNVGNVLSAPVSGLSPSTYYFFRVRSNKASLPGQGATHIAQQGQSTLSQPLALAVLDLTATASSDRTAVLRWLPAQGEEAVRYEVERSTDGLHFEPIGSEEAGNATSYSITDKQPAEGLNQYRLSALMADSTRAYSATRNLRFSGAQSAAALVYPNPAVDVITIEASSAALRNTEAVLLDARGQAVRRVTLAGAVTALDMRALPAGVYTVRFADGTAVRVSKAAR